MTAALCGLVAWLTWAAAGRLASRCFPVPVAHSERYLQTLTLAALLITLPVAGLGFAGWLSGAALAVVAVAGFALAWGLTRSSQMPQQQPSIPLPDWVRWPMVLTALAVTCDVLAHLPMPPIDWDAVTYHLYLPARWLQEGRIFHVPTVFSDNAAAYAPQNGALFFAWQMALTGYDLTTNVSQLVCLALLALALYRICRLLRVDRGSALLAVTTLPWLAPVRRWTYSANVDLFMLAFAIAALYWGLRYLERPTAGTALAGGLASGLAAGTKAIGLPLVALLTLPFVAATLGRRPGDLGRRRLGDLGRRRLGDLVRFLAAALVSGGWWYVLNLWRTGNPLFPVRLSLLGLIELPGAYGSEALRAGEFHLDGLGAVGQSVRLQWGLTTCLLMVLGLIALASRARRDLCRRRRRPHAALLLALALLWAAFFVSVVPHNNQARFALPTLAISLVGWALLLQQARRAGRRRALALWSVGIAAAALAAQPWRDLLGSLTTLARDDVALPSWLLTGWLMTGCLALALAAALALRRTPRPALWVIAGLVVLTGLALPASQAARPAFFAYADYRGWADGYLPFNAAAAEPARIAYAGANVPYALMGGDRRHRVVYLNTQGATDDGFYEHWRRDPRSYPYHKPGLYRGQDDVDLWLQRLAEQRIDTLVIFALHPAERRYLRSTPEGFPIERQWAQLRPDRFQRIAASRAAEIYRVAQ
ncbi:MAG: hypothetical protein AAF560_16405 [Acidobacteriota bacterium]